MSDIVVRFTASEARVIAQAAKRLGVSPSDFIRHRAVVDAYAELPSRGSWREPGAARGRAAASRKPGRVAGSVKTFAQYSGRKTGKRCPYCKQPRWQVWETSAPYVKWEECGGIGDGVCEKYAARMDARKGR